MASASSTSMPRYLTVLSTLVCPSRSCTARRLIRAPVDHGRLGASERVGAENMRVQSDACDPLGNQAGVLPRCHALSGPTPARKQKLAGPLAHRLQVGINRLAGMLGQFESDRAAGFLLTRHGARDCMPVGSNVLNPQVNEITAPELAVD